MQKIILPYVEEIFINREIPPAQFDDNYHLLLKEKNYNEGYFVLDTSERTHYLFISDGHPYAAGAYDSRGFRSVQIRDFFSAYLQTRPHTLSFYRTDEILTKSIIVLFQHSPTMQVTTDLVDVEEILEKIRQKGTDTLLTIIDQNQSSIVLCQQGIPSKTYLIEPGEATGENSATDQMLVYIYSKSGSRNITIDVYQEIIISKAADAAFPPEAYQKTISDYFTRAQPDLHVMLGDQSITKYRIKGHGVKIGRVPENDIVINNLGVSRRHAEIIEEAGRYYALDAGSVNGTFVNGQKIEKTLLNDNDEVLIGKHKIIFLHSDTPGGGGVAMQESQTMMMDAGMVTKLRQSAQVPAAKIAAPDGQIFDLVQSKTVIGNAPSADITLDDQTIAPEQAQIIRDESGYRLIQLSTQAATIVNGQTITDSCPLNESTNIQIGQTVITFKLEE